MKPYEFGQKPLTEQDEATLNIVKVQPSRPEPMQGNVEAARVHEVPTEPTRTYRSVSSVTSVAEHKVEQITHEHDPRQQIHPLFFVIGLLLALVGLWLLFNDPVLFGERRSIPGNSSIEEERKTIVAARVETRVRDGALVAPIMPMPTAPQPRAAPTPVPNSGGALPTQFAPGFIDELSRSAQATGVSKATADRVLGGLGPLDTTISDLNVSQPEHTKSAGDYVAQRVTAERMDLGRRRLGAHASLLAAVEKRYGVDRQILTAIWGIESNYGTEMGSRSVTRSLATLAAVDARRPQLWRDELFAALAIIDKGDATVETMSGSWAGAMGHMQFMPSSFQKHAVDFDGDGRRDIWSNPGDALASAANFLKASGWVTGRAWGREVTLPGNFDLTLAAPNVGKTVTAWQMLGVRPTTGLIPLDDDPNWQIILPAGAKGPAFLVSSNFEVLLKYNRAMPYALAVGHLADRLAGGGAIAAAWPVDDIGLSKDEIGDVQRALAGFGHDPGPIDSIIGAQTRAAIRAFQQARQLPPDGHASLGLLRRLRNERRI